ncbi:MAG: CvpA family protein [Thiobacillaceae bacterium]|nr:CvpA family protein [Thiobacillaceae bacterium]
MTTLDLIVLGVLALSSLAGYLRGLTHEVFNLAAWVLAFIAAKSLGPWLASWVPGVGVEALRYLIAIVVVFILALIFTRLAATVVAGMVQWVGLGFYDKALGGVFGALRGGLLLLFLTLLAGLTALPRTDFWQRSYTHDTLEAAARKALPWLPARLAEHIRYAEG